MNGRERARGRMFLRKSDRRTIAPNSLRQCLLSAHKSSANASRERVLIVAHAGMGSIITALEYGKPIIVLPRRGQLRETRNDHQFATAKHFSQQGRITAAFDERDLVEKLDHFEASSATNRVDLHASPRLISVIRDFIDEKPHAPAQPKSST